MTSKHPKAHPLRQPLAQQGVRLGVNVDHIATIRQARLTHYPSPLEAAMIAEQAGADGITIHIREDRRHIQEQDLIELQADPKRFINLEIAVTEEMLAIALQHQPQAVCFVPEKRQELTTEGGLDVRRHFESIKAMTRRLKNQGIRVALFIDAELEQINAAAEAGADCIELHTGEYAEQPINSKAFQQRLEGLCQAAKIAHHQGLMVHAGHGLNYHNTQQILQIPHLQELNIGHAIIARALLVGMKQAVDEMIVILRSHQF